MNTTTIKSNSKTELAVINKLVARGSVGKENYGDTMDRNDLTPSEWAKHAQEEMLDGVQYLERLMRSLELLEGAAGLLNQLDVVCISNTNLANDIRDWLHDYKNQFGQCTD